MVHGAIDGWVDRHEDVKLVAVMGTNRHENVPS